MESVVAELYDVLEQLRYPELAKIEAKNFATIVLTGDNRIKLLSWLLSRASPTLAKHFESLNGPDLEDEIVKCYSQMGISNKEKALLGNCPAKHQIPVLRTLISYAKSLDESTEIEKIEESRIDALLVKYINGTSNIVSMIKNTSKFIQIENSKPDVATDRSTTKNETEVLSHELTEAQSSTIKRRSDDRVKVEVEAGQKLELDSAVAIFAKGFESVFTEKSKPPDSKSVQPHNLDDTIDVLNKNFHSIISVLKAKEFIYATNIPQSIDKSETPLSKFIEDNIILTDEMASLFDE